MERWRTSQRGPTMSAPRRYPISIKLALHCRAVLYSTDDGKTGRHSLSLLHVLIAEVATHCLLPKRWTSGCERTGALRCHLT